VWKDLWFLSYTIKMAAPDRFTTAGSLPDMHHDNQLKGQSFRKVGNEPVTVIAYLLLKRALIKEN
jgi:hypothetical protein